MDDYEEPPEGYNEWPPDDDEEGPFEEPFSFGDIHRQVRHNRCRVRREEVHSMPFAQLRLALELEIIEPAQEEIHEPPPVITYTIQRLEDGRAYVSYGGDFKFDQVRAGGLDLVGYLEAAERLVMRRQHEEHDVLLVDFIRESSLIFFEFDAWFRGNTLGEIIEMADSLRRGLLGPLDDLNRTMFVALQNIR